MYDVIIIGGGPGGYAAAIRAAQLTAKVALVEADTLGGTCVNLGCIPVKVWLRAADTLRRIQGASDFGIQAKVDGIDFQTIVDRKNGVSSDIRMGMEALLGNHGVDVIKGRAIFKSPKKIDVKGIVYQAKNYILATGSRMALPDIPGLEDALLTTDQAFDLQKIPSSVLIYGAGPVEVEMASIFIHFGSKVCLAAQSRRILPREDPDSSQRLAQVLREDGLKLSLGQKLTSVEPEGNGFTCSLTGSKDTAVTVERVLCAPRIPNTENLGLDTAGVLLKEDRSIQVDDHLQTSAQGIYAIGDAAGGTLQSHAASAMGITAAQNIMGLSKPFPFNLVPRGVWSFPEVASVGLTEEEAEDLDLDVTVGEFPYSINGLAMAVNEIKGSVKVVSDDQYGKILGVHIVGPNANELIGEAVVAMQFEYTIAELASGIRVHPTFSENMVDAARDAEGWALYLPKR
ncbi:MAG: dihydrolipoyl dehydrogenase [Deltaproteobacteria bacterium]|nr:MAG: dihydrolipoyl dehydrogenase [Deltaproteobacteria bacterium]RLC20949.1 MAG: dihydrolipoyl dehydrogenase [Deltaproteobacteria bacterium]